jgi:hypothetical protein
VGLSMTPVSAMEEDEQGKLAIRAVVLRQLRRQPRMRARMYRSLSLSATVFFAHL